MAHERAKPEAEQKQKRSADSAEEHHEEQSSFSLNRANVLDLQRTVGNQRTQALVAQNRVPVGRGTGLPALRGVVQPKTEESDEKESQENALDGAFARVADAPRPPSDGDAGGISRQAGRKLIQRTLTDEEKKTWDSMNGDTALANLKGAVETWKTWRKQPSSYEQMPKGDSLNISALSELVRLNGQVFAKHISDELGADVKYLGEMASFVPNFRLLIGMVPGVVYVDAKHKYELTAIEPPYTIMKSMPFGKLEVKYSNAFGWNWKRELQGSFMSIEASIGGGGGASRDVDVGDDGLPKLDDDFKTKKKFKPEKPKISGGVAFNIPGQISVNGTANAKSIPYWGADDLGGPVLVANGPSVKGVVAGFGGKAASGGLITFTGTGTAPGTLVFENFAAKFAVDVETPKKPSDLMKAEISISIAEVGGGGVLEVGTPSYTTPEPEPKAIDSERTWHAWITNFAVGSAEVPADASVYLENLKIQVQAKKEEIDAQKAIFEQLAIDPTFKLEIAVDGYASRPWAGAANPADRKMKNIELSQKRADAVSAMVGTLFGDYNFGMTAIGKGASVAIVTYDIKVEEGEMVKNERKEEVLTELDDAEKIEKIIKEREDQYRKDFPDMSEQEIRKNARRGLGDSGTEAEDPNIRRVSVTVKWKGKEIVWGAAPSGK